MKICLSCGYATPYYWDTDGKRRCLFCMNEMRDEHVWYFKALSKAQKGLEREGEMFQWSAKSWGDKMSLYDIFYTIFILFVAAVSIFLIGLSPIFATYGYQQTCNLFGVDCHLKDYSLLSNFCYSHETHSVSDSTYIGEGIYNVECGEGNIYTVKKKNTCTSYNKWHEEMDGCMVELKVVN